MKLIVGLGNPGVKYKNNRHNAGFMLIDELDKRNLPEVKLFKPQKFMNRSGGEVKKFLKKNPGERRELYVAHDDLDLSLGKFKISRKGPLIHNGLNSIYKALGTKDFWHIRLGIDAGREGKTPEEFVLANFKPEERELIILTIKKAIQTIWGE